MPLISALMEADTSEFETRLVYRVSSGIATATQ